jgi:hypothetical protein
MERGGTCNPTLLNPKTGLYLLMRRRRSLRRMISRFLRPGGTAESSPALQCWGAKGRSWACLGVPEGRLSTPAGRRSAAPPGLGGASQPPEPSVETLGYPRPSLRDEDRGSHSWVAPKKAQDLTSGGPGKGDWVCATPPVTKRKMSPRTASPSPSGASAPRRRVYARTPRAPRRSPIPAAPPGGRTAGDGFPRLSLTVLVRSV